MMKTIAIIPARYESLRLPRKMMLDLGGIPLIHRVYQNALKIDVFDHVLVACDHPDILMYCQNHNIPCRMTGVHHPSGTDRVAEVAFDTDADIIVNLQGDEPFLEAGVVSEMLKLFDRREVEIATMAVKMENDEFLFDYNKIKLVFDLRQRVLYFSRQAIPGHRDLPYRDWFSHSDYFMHLGVYAFRRKTLLEVAKLKPSKLEKSEKLEQLRWMENGYNIHVAVVRSHSFGIDCLEDMERARLLLKSH